MVKKITLLLLFVCLLYADNPILRPNEALVIDAKTNEINFVLELSKDGKIKKRFLSQSEKDALYKTISAETKIAESKRNLSNMADSAISKKSDSAKAHNSHIKQWDKKKIIYEQSVHKIDILR